MEEADKREREWMSAGWPANSPHHMHGLSSKPKESGIGILGHQNS